MLRRIITPVVRMGMFLIIWYTLFFLLGMTGIFYNDIGFAGLSGDTTFIVAFVIYWTLVLIYYLVRLYSDKKLKNGKTPSRSFAE